MFNDDEPSVFCFNKAYTVTTGIYPDINQIENIYSRLIRLLYH